MIGGSNGGSTAMSGNVGGRLRRRYHGPPTGDSVPGNFIGTDVTGTIAIGNGGVGIRIPSSICHDHRRHDGRRRNVISGNTGDGVDITGSGTTGNVVEGNYIGTDELDHGGANGAGVSITAGATGNTIGGTTPGAGNVISADDGIDGVNGNDAGVGVLIEGSAASGNLVEGNVLSAPTRPEPSRLPT